MLETMTRGGDRDKMGKRWWRNNGVLSNDDDAFSVRVPRMRHMKAACPESPCTPDCPQGCVPLKTAYKMIFFDDAAQLVIDNGTRKDLVGACALVRE